MAHNTRTQLDATWTTGNYVVLPADWSDLDRKVFEAINGDRGGCWAPSSPVVITGSAGVAKLNVSGPARIDYGGSLRLTSGATIRLADGDWPRLGATHVLRNRTIVTSCLQRQTTPDYHFVNAVEYGGIRSIACTIQFPPYVASIFAQTITPGKVVQPSFVLPLRVHDGARLASATLTFRVIDSRSTAPVIPPRMRIVRASASGVLETLQSTSAGADVNGYAPVSAADSGSAWYADGAVQSFTYACDQNHIVDLSQYTYFAQIIEETGALLPIPVYDCDGTVVRERKVDVAVATTANISLTGAQAIDGVAVGNASPIFTTQDRVLVKDQTDHSQNGIWIAATGAWTRATDLDSAPDFTPGFLVKVTAGTVNANTIWECRDPVNTQQITLASIVGTPVHFRRRLPRGNVFIAVAANHEDIADMRWQ